MQVNTLVDKIKNNLMRDYGKEAKDASIHEMHNVVAQVVISQITDRWNEANKNFYKNRHAYYLSAEFLMGRAVQNNLICIGIFDEVKDALNEIGFDINQFEEIEDMALGNGGLGRLAACFLDSAATCDIPLNGYGIRYKFGLFKQAIEDGFQKEYADNWTAFGDEWSLRRFEDSVKVKFDDMEVVAVPYDMPIIGYGTENIGTLRLWQSEAVNEFNFELFNNCEYDEAIKEKTEAENISAGLYPNDNTEAGKVLRYRQQYFFTSASIQDLLKKYKAEYGNDFSKLVELNSIQLNDTHPVVAIPEFIRIMTTENNVSFDEAFIMAKEVFNYTNHTVMAEALEKWNIELVEKYTPEVFAVIEEINKRLIKELKKLKVKKKDIAKYEIISDGQVHMARMATYIGKYVNGVAEIHSEILKKDTLKEWYDIYPDKFQNKTNGITQRRWLACCNPELTELLTRLVGDDSFLKDLDKLKNIERYADDDSVIKEYIEIKKKKKRQLIEYIEKHEGIRLEEHFIFDIQIKRLHEYKRQLLNTLYILDLYYRLKENPDMDIPKVTFIYGAKAFPGYKRAKSIVKLTNEVAKLINNDESIKGKIKVVFVENYRVSYAEKLFPAADVSKQISTAGKEASGTGNMKFMLNGAPTFGTNDGANVEIVRESGVDNNFIFGLEVEEIEELKGKYDPVAYYEADADLKRVLDSLVDGTFDDGGTGDFEDLYNSLLEEGDQYFLLADFKAFKDTEDKVFEAYKDKLGWAKKAFENTCNAGMFSSDRTIQEYCDDIWGIKKCTNK